MTVAPILAHGIGGRSDLPVPLWLAQYGAVTALVVSFVVLITFWKTPRLEAGAAGAGRPLPAWLQRVVAALGPNSSAVNPAPTWVYVWFWVGLVPASILLGPVWRLLNSLRTVSAGLARLARDPEPRPMPPWLGYWPAAAGLAVFAWLELVYLYRDEPFTLLVFFILYGTVQLWAGFLYGQDWYARGDPFEVYSSLLGSLSPFGRR